MKTKTWGAVARRLFRNGAVAVGIAALTITALPATANAAENGTLVVCATDSAGQNVVLGGDQAWYQRGSSAYVGAVGESGCREQSLTPGAVKVWVGKDGTRSHIQDAVIESGETTRVDFYTTKVTIKFPGAVAFGGAQGDSAHWGSAPRELFSTGTTPTMFRFTLGGKVARTPISWPVANGTGKSVTKLVSMVQVLNGAGTGLEGVQVQYNTNGGSTLYWVKDADGALRKTDAAGLLAFPVDLPTASVANAENVTIQVGINNTTDRGTFSTSSTTLPTFQTANVVMNYNHLVQYRQGGTPETGQVHYWLTKSGMELFPGSYSFQFQVPDKKMGNAKAVYPGLTLDLVPGVTVKTAAAVRFTDSAGDGLADGVVRYWRNGVWNYPADGQTDGPGGTWVTLFDGAPGKITFALDYKGGIQQLAQQDLAAASVAYFQTVPVTVKLIDHAGRPLDTGNATFYAQSWKPIGDTVGGQVSTELLPVKHSFAMTYLGSRQQVTVEAVSATPVVFQTGRLTSSDKWISSFYTTSWQTFPAGGVELLPSKVTVRPTTGSQFAVTVEPGEILDLSNG